MKKTFNFYCILLIVALVATSIIDFSSNIKSFIRGFQDGYGEANVAWGKEEGNAYNPDHSHWLTLYPDQFTHYNDSIYNSLSGEYIPVNHYLVDAYAPDFQGNNASTWLIVFAAILGFAAVVLMLPSFIAIIYSINKGMIFSDRISLLLNLLGISLIALFLSALCEDYGRYLICVNNFAAEGYTISMPNTHDSMYLMFGIALLAISQVIKMAKKMKEEQELTI